MTIEDFDPGAFGAATPPGPAPRDARNDRSSRAGGSQAKTGKQGGGGDAAAVDLNRRCAFFPRTDLGNAERFKERFGEVFRWCGVIGWLAWDGRRWSREWAESMVSQAVYDTVRAIREEAELVRLSGMKDDSDNEDALDFVVKATKDRVILWSDTIHQWALSSEAAGRLSCIADLAKPWLEVEPGAFDADPMAINVMNGTLRFESAGEGCSEWVARLDPHRREDLLMKLAPVEYDPGATCPRYDAFIGRMQPDPEMRRFIHAWAGYSLTGDISEQKLAIHHGGGSNGKSTMVEAHAFVAGDYAGALPIETFLEQGRHKRGGDPTPDLATLPGVRFLRTSEPEQGAKLAEALIKLATGGEMLKVRHLNKDFFEFRPQFKLTISCNPKPSIKGTDDGIWRRVQLVPWAVQITDAEKDRALPEKLRAEGPGILNRLIEGLLDWKAGGLPTPGTVIEATAEYRASSDPLGRFLEIATRRTPGARTQSSILHASYVAWAKTAGEVDSISPKLLSMKMSDKGFVKTKNSVSEWVDLELVMFPRDFAEAPPMPMEDDYGS